MRKRTDFPHSRLSVDASVGFAQSLDDLQSIQKLVGTFNPQQFLPAEAVSSLREGQQDSADALGSLTQEAVISSYRRNKETHCVVRDVLEGLEHLGTCRKQHQ